MQLIKKHVCTRIAPSILLQNAEGYEAVSRSKFIVSKHPNAIHRLIATLKRFITRLIFKPRLNVTFD